MNYWTQSKDNIYVAAHRGWSTVYPENTLLAFKKAIEIGVDQIETDVRITRDGELVCIHDATVDRTTNGTGKVCDKLLSELKTLDAGSWKGAEFAGERIPTFIEFLDENDPQDKKHIDYYNEYFSEKTAVAGQYSVFTFTQEELLKLTGPGVEKAVVFTTLADGTKSITAQELAGMTVGANYSISDVFVRVKDARGNEVLKNVFRAKSPRVREVSMTEMNSSWQKFMYDGVQDFADGKHTLEITVQLSTGELLTAFSGKLNP